MTNGASIEYLPNNKIDKEKWDLCIENASNGLIYGYSFYLDHLSPKWGGIVLNNYEAVMPLPTRQKFGISYLYQPAFCAQLGVFGNHLNREIFDRFLDSIPSKFKYWDLALNFGNRFDSSYKLYQRINYVLDLNQSYENIERNYRDNVRRNIKKAYKYGCQPVKGIDSNQVMKFAEEFSPGIKPEDLNSLKKVILVLEKTGQSLAYGVYSSKNELLASCIFFFSHNRAYYILVGNHPNGRTLGASHLLIDAFIRDHANRNILLDFEGSDIRNIAFFYSSFGAKEELYTAIKLNNLPAVLKWVKE